MQKIVTMTLFVFVLCSPALAQEHVQVFVTPAAFDGNLGGLNGADSICTNAANDAGLSGNWTAWLSTSGADARDRIQDAEYRLVDGTVVANDLNDLTDGSLDHPIDVDANGAIVGESVAVWTGTVPAGTVSENTCTNWTSDTAVPTCVIGPNANCGTRGDSTQTDQSWTQGTVPWPCAALRGLYCFSDSLIPVELEEFSVE